jgi:tetratricopeptide (TPR) repeat protein
MPAPKREQLIQEAERLAARGKLDAAIREFERAVELVPQDTTALNRLGDLLVKADRVGDAIDVYRRIGEHFAEDGFFLKSIAIYKKINRFDPQRTDIYERLADLYYKQGLAVEGRQQLLTLAEWFTRSHNLDDALRVFRRLAELEPGNLQVRAKLLDALIQRGDVAAVSVEIDALGQSLIQRGMLDEAVKLYHRAIDLRPENVEFVARCIAALAEHGRAQQAVDLAARALAATTPGVDLTVAAAEAFNAAGELKRARTLLDGIMPHAADRIEVVQIYAEVLAQLGDVARAKSAVLPVVDRLISTRDPRRAAQLLRRMLKVAAEDVDVLSRAVRVFDRRDEPELVTSLEAALAEAYFKAGRITEAIPLYRRLVEDHPDNTSFAERLAALVPAPRSQSAPTGFWPGTGQRPPVDAAPPAVVMGEEIEFVDLDVGGALDGTDSTTIGAAPAAPPEEIASHGAPAVPTPLEETAVDELFTEAVVFAKYGLADKAVTHLQRLLELQPSHVEALDLLAGLTGETAGDEPSPRATETAPRAQEPERRDGPAEPQVHEPAAEPAKAEPPVSWQVPAAAPAAAPPAASSAPAEAPIPQPLPLHRPTAATTVRVEDLEAALGISRPAVSRRAPKPPPLAVEFGRLESLAAMAEPRPMAPPVEWSPTVEPEVGAAPTGQAMPGGEDEAAFSFEEPVEVLEEAAEVVDVADVLGGPDVEQLREVDFLIEQGLLDEAGRSLAALREGFADHPEVVSRQAALKARGWDETARPVAPVGEAGTAEELFGEEEQFFDLAAELERELADEELVAEATGSAQTGEVSIEELFKEFQRGVAEQVSEQDYDTHFNLGLAYREMGLYDEAIGEFQLAGKSPDYLVECSTMIGACYMEKGLPEQAAEWYDRALKAPGLPPEAELGLRYELGRTQEAAGNPGAALAHYAEVLAINPAFRDVVDRVSRLQAG